MNMSPEIQLQWETMVCPQASPWLGPDSLPAPSSHLSEQPASLASAQLTDGQTNTETRA